MFLREENAFTLRGEIYNMNGSLIELSAIRKIFKILF